MKEVKNWKDILNLFDYITDVKLDGRFGLVVTGMKNDEELIHEATYTFAGISNTVKQKLDNFINIK